MDATQRYNLELEIKHQSETIQNLRKSIDALLELRNNYEETIHQLRRELAETKQAMLLGILAE